MDYTKISRDIIYSNRQELAYYVLRHDLLSIIVDNMQDLDFLNISDFEQRSLTCLNTAFYICTMAMMELNPGWRWSEYRELAYCEQKYHKEKYQVTVLSIVTILLRHYNKEWQEKNERFICTIEEFVNKRYLYEDEAGKPLQNMHNQDLSYIYETLSCGTEQEIILPDDLFAPRNIIEVIENTELRKLTSYKRYIVDRIKQLDDPHQRTFAKDATIKHLTEGLEVCYQKYGYDPETKQFMSDGKFIHMDFNLITIYNNNIEVLSETIDYIKKSLPTIEENADEPTLSTEEKNNLPDTPVSLEQFNSENAQLKKQLEDSKNEFTELEKKYNSLKQELKELKQPVEELSAHQKVRMELAKQLLYKAGLTDDTLKVFGNNQKTATLMSLLLDIKNKNAKGNAAQTCATFISAKEVLSKKHHDIVEQINALLSKLGIDIQLVTAQ